MRNKVHATFVAIAKEAVRHSAPRETVDRQHPSRIQASDITEVDFPFLFGATIPEKYACSVGLKLAEWLPTICSPDEPVQAISWFQLTALFEYQTASGGLRHNKSRKKWEDNKDHTTSHDFVARSKSMSNWIQGLAKALQAPTCPRHLRPASEIITFWTMCISMRIKPQAKQLAEDILRGSSPKLTTVQSLRSL